MLKHGGVPSLRLADREVGALVPVVRVARVNGGQLNKQLDTGVVSISIG